MQDNIGLVQKMVEMALMVVLFLVLANAFSFSLDSLKNKRVLVVGGSGRVGGSVVTQLIQRKSVVVVGGTSQDRFQVAQERWRRLFPQCDRSLSEVTFVSIDRDDKASVAAKLCDFDLVVNTAGPFQGKVGQSMVLEACVEKGIAYIDVCDDYCTAKAAKTKHDVNAQDNNVPCIISTGCWPGVSSLMAKQLVSIAQERDPTIRPINLSVDFSFFTAGSGGAGVTLLVATFLILAEQALTVVNGRRIGVPPMTGYSTVNFGSTVGDRDVAHLNLLETASIHDNLRVGNVQSLFGTAPDFWNALLGLMAKLPSSLLANEDIMRNLSIFSLPIVRLVDTFAGATNAMRCDVKTDAMCLTAIYAHENLEPCVGECVVAFCAAVLGGAVAPGVHFPEEAINSGPEIAKVLEMASVGAHTEVRISGSTKALANEEVWGPATAMVS